VSDAPTVLVCVGATKAGTSWLYRYLHDHPDCHLRSIKELHLFDSLDFDDCAHQYAVLERLRGDLARRRDAAEAAGEDWRRANLTRQIEDAEAAEAMLRAGEAAPEAAGKAWLAYLLAGAEGRRLVADITPAYGLLAQERLARIAALAPEVRFVFLMRDPLERLWSHVRMHARRNCPPHNTVPRKSRNIMRRILMRGQERHITARGDYAGTVSRLRAAVPPERLHIGFTEEVLTEAGLRALCDFLGIPYRPADTGQRVHRGVALDMDDETREMAARYLAPQYDFVAKTFGRLPAGWQANMARA